MLKVISDKSGESVNQIINEGLKLVFSKYSSQGLVFTKAKDTTVKERRGKMIQPDNRDHAGHIVAFTNNKGGVAKTTTCTSIAVLLGEQGKNVLVVDFDMQKNASDLMGYDFDSDNPSVADYFRTYFNNGRERDVKNYILPTRYSNVDVMIADPNMQTDFEHTLQSVSVARGDLVGHLFKDLKALNLYDYILVDTQPSMGVLVISTYMEADWLVIPADTDKHGIEGAVKVCNFIEMRHADGLKAANIAGVVFVRADERTSIAKAMPEIRHDLTEGHIRCFNSSIPQSADVPKARMEGYTVTDRYPFSKVSKRYESLLAELEDVIHGRI